MHPLMSVFVADLKNRNAANKGRDSALARFQERILTALYRRTIMVHA
jgi:hypothetical protein